MSKIKAIKAWAIVWIYKNKDYYFSHRCDESEMSQYDIFRTKREAKYVKKEEWGNARMKGKIIPVLITPILTKSKKKKI